MRRLVTSGLLAAVALAFSGLTATAQDQWATIKGQVLFPANKPIPKRNVLNVSQDKDHCLSKGDILDESVIINAKNRGVKNVVVYLRPDNTDPKSDFPKNKIHPDDAKRKAAEVVIDQPCCMFVKRITVARVGDKLVVKNPAPVAHNFFWDTSNNGAENISIPKMESWTMKQPLKKEGPPIQYKCTIHPWMTGYVRIFDHPYYAVTDEDGKFEIKNAPVGKYRIVYWHENGVRGGAKGRFGDQIDIQGPVLDLKTIEYDVSPK
ncbi:MAG: hypothetical protein L0241_25245 [Planctomycetia bacterium]|nr:hypothetical protein [Planctomycetia bacterium]